MARPTIRDLAAAAGVSVATVNRVLGNSAKVRPATMQQVLDAAQQIGFYAVGALRQRVAAAQPRQRLGVVVQTPHRPFTQALTSHLEQAAAALGNAVQLQCAHVDDLSPESVAARMLALGETCDALAVVAAEHPIVSDAIERLAAQGVPVLALVSPLAARVPVGYVGLDSWKDGRTAAWAFEHLCPTPGKLAILVGTHRYRGHDLRESGFRSYFREHGAGFQLLEPVATFESDAIAREVTERLLRSHPDLRGLYVSGGGIAGALAALRDSGRTGPPRAGAPGRAEPLVTVGYDLLDTTRAGLLDGTLTLVISHPFQALARETLAALGQAAEAAEAAKTAPPGAPAGGPTVLLPFELYTRENL